MCAAAMCVPPVWVLQRTVSLMPLAKRERLWAEP